MAKRAREDERDGVAWMRPSKRSKMSDVDHLSTLSDELILRVLSFLSESQLVLCQRLSHKYHNLAGDSQLWKALYYDRFVRPRASRVPSYQIASANANSSKTSKWLDEEHLAKRRKMNWKRQYKLRHNWSQGKCAVREIPVAEHAAAPPVLAQMHGGMILVANRADGLRAWSAKERKPIAQLSLSNSNSAPPTSLAVDKTAGTTNGPYLLLGFEDGSFRVYILRRDPGEFVQLYSHSPSNGAISAVAISFPHALTMSAKQELSLYRFHGHSSSRETHLPLGNPRLLHRLKSHTVCSPLSTSMRRTASAIVICMAYALPTYLSGWTIGVQEIRVSLDGKVLGSRTTSAIDEHYRPLAHTTRPMNHHIAPDLSTATLETRHTHSKPTSLSYTHPYLLVSHPDNTLSLHLVSSTAESLSIGPGSRLWGHSSAVSGAIVGRLGKAVSVSKHGDELRVWELEGGFTTIAAKKRLANGDLSVKVKADTSSAGAGRDLSGAEIVSNALTARSRSAACGIEESRSDDFNLAMNRGWVEFDEEKVVVLKEDANSSVLVVYDFT